MSTSRSLNKVILIGNLTRDPVIRETNNGSVVCTFGLATNSTWKDSKSNVQERTEFHNIVAWNKLGEICAQLLSTGMAIYVEGELRTRTWDDANGVRHFRTEIKLQDMKLLDDKGKKGVGLDSAKKIGEKVRDTEEFNEETTERAAAPASVINETAVQPDKTTEKAEIAEDDDGEDLF